MRTQDEIVARIEEAKKTDIFGFEITEYIPFLDYTHAKPFLMDGTTEEQYTEMYKPMIDENILAAMKSYMEFAWEKANNCRGISANRSMAHYKAWLWLLNDGFLEQFERIEYEHYGKEKLIAICEKYGWDWKSLDDEVRTNGEL